MKRMTVLLEAEISTTPASAVKASGRRGPRLRPVLLGAAGIALFLLLLDLVGGLGNISSDNLPRSATILHALVRLPLDLEFLSAMGATLWATWAGLGIAVALGVPIGILLGTWNPLFHAVSVLIEFLRPLPAVALIPPVLLMMGSGPQMKITLIAYGTFWIILFNTIYGIRGVDSGLKDTARVFGTGRLKALVTVSLPSAMPFIYTGIKIASTAAFIIAVGVEMVAGGGGGFGTWEMTHLIGGLNRELVFAGAFAAGLVGLIMTGALSWVGKKAFPWSNANRGGAE